MGCKTLSTYHVTVWGEPTFQTVPVVGLVIFGTQTSLSDTELRIMGAAEDVVIVMTKEKRSATGDLMKIIKVRKSEDALEMDGGV